MNESTLLCIEFRGKFVSPEFSLRGDSFVSTTRRNPSLSFPLLAKIDLPADDFKRHQNRI